MLFGIGLATLVLLTVTSVGQLRATVLAYDPGDYTPDERVDGLHGGFGWRTTWTGINQVVDSNLEYSSLQTLGRAFGTVGNSEPSFRQLATGGRPSLTDNGMFGREGTTLWVSFLFHRREQSSDGWAGLSLFNGASEELFIGQPVNQNRLGLHVWDFGQAPAGLEMTDLPILNGATYFLVVRIEFRESGDQDLVELFVNPTVGRSPGESQARREGADIRFNWIRLASGYGAIESTIDEIRIGTEYHDVAPGIARPPSPARFDNAVYSAANGFSATLELEPGYRYRIQSTDNFDEWSDVESFIAHSRRRRFNASKNEPGLRRFFRIISP